MVEDGDKYSVVIGNMCVLYYSRSNFIRCVGVTVEKLDATTVKIILRSSPRNAPSMHHFM